MYVYAAWFWLNNQPNFYFSFFFHVGQDQFDTIDLSDNEIVKLENFPLLNRLGTLIINNNRITRINPSIGGNYNYNYKIGFKHSTSVRYFWYHHLLTLEVRTLFNVLQSSCQSYTH